MFAPVLLAAVLTASPPAPIAPPARDLGSAAFAADLYRAAAAADPGVNLLISPESVRAALAMAHAGAEGETAAELAAALRLPTGADGRVDHAAVGRLLTGLNVPPAPARGGGEPGDGVTVAPANTVFLDASVTLAPAFLAAVRDGFGAAPEPAPFTADPAAAAGAVNGWVSDKTAGKIPRVVDADDVRGLPLALVNALHVKAPWRNDFAESRTEPAPFTRDDGTTAEVPLMFKWDDLPLTVEPDGTAAVRLFYEGGRLTFTAVLPPDGTPLAEFDRGLTPDRLARLLTGGEVRDTKVYLPRFEVETTTELGEPLRSAGVRRAFTNAAEFGPMLAGDAGPPLKIAAVVHAAVIEVDEEGTEAAAATVVLTGPTSAPFQKRPEPYLFRADRPFLFALHDVRTGAVLFLGRYAGPRTHPERVPG